MKYKYNEDSALRDIEEYINKTYGQHYSQNKLQTTEFVIDAGHGVGFTVGNIIKYAQRYGKKNGYNRDDILKIIHYAIMLLHVHDTQIKDNNE
jgi:membrane-anchored protein YejM (alkaline phosphatase superfamily)